LCIITDERYALKSPQTKCTTFMTALPQCYSYAMSLLCNVTLTQCHSHSMSLLHNVTRTQCHSHLMSLSLNVTFTQCHSYAMSLLLHVTLTQCHTHCHLCLLFITDESHTLKSAQSKRTIFMTNLLQSRVDQTRALLMTGTPIMSRPIEIFPQVCVFVCVCLFSL